MRFAAWAAALLFAFAQGSQGARGDETAPSAPSAAALYDAAADRWKALPLPPFATYATDAVATRKGRVEERRSEVYYRESDGRCTIVGVPLDARDRPDPPDFESRCLSPNYSFGFVPERHAVFGPSIPLEVPTAEPASGDAPKEIAAITVRTRPYALTLAGTEAIEGKAAIHLVLRPYRDPAKYVLRDLWIDPATDAVVRLRGEATSTANLAHVIFDAYYDEGPRQQTLHRITGYVKAQLLLLKIGADFTYDLYAHTYPAALPDWYFNRTAYTLNGGIPNPGPQPAHAPNPQ